MNTTPEYLRAQTIAKKATKSGVLVIPSTCMICETSGKRLQKHHLHYDFPILVVWLCARCHKRAHLGRLKVDLVPRENIPHTRRTRPKRLLPPREPRPIIGKHHDIKEWWAKIEKMASDERAKA